jgi:lipid-A-disaccharide synthase
MQQLKCRCLFSIDDLSFMGILDVFWHLPKVLHIRRTLINYFLREKIDLFIGVDFPDFNLSIETALKKASIKTVHYISPTIWAWRPWRIKKIRRAVNLMLGIYPFEQKYYATESVNFKFVGHPLTRQIRGPFDAIAKRKLLGLSQQKKLLALLPGSRTREINQLAKIFILTAKECVHENSQIACVAALTNTLHAKLFKIILDQTAPNFPITLVVNQTYSVLEAADVVLLSSGTATLETMLFEKPMVVAYRLDWLSYWIGRLLVFIHSIALPNILASQRLVPEFIQNDVTVRHLKKAVMTYFDDATGNKQLICHYRQLRQTLENNIDPAIVAFALKELIER